MLTARIRKERRNPDASSFVLDVSIEVSPGITILFGSSGAGKSTMLDSVEGLTRPDEGRIAVGSDVLFDSARGINVSASKRRTAYVFQTLALFPHLSAEENVAYGLTNLREEEKRSQVEAILKAFRVEKLRKQKPAEISGGEKQRIALARSLVTEPRVLLLDEPLTGLDAGLKAAIVDDLRAWNAAKGIPILYVTHSRGEVDALGESVIARDDGHCACGLRRRVYCACHPRGSTGAGANGRASRLAGVENALLPPRGVRQKSRARNFQDFGFGGAGVAGLVAAGTENLISSASRALSLGVAWMTTRSPAARSPALAGLSSLLALDRKTVEAAIFTCTDFPSGVFTTTESALIFSTVPIT